MIRPAAFVVMILASGCGGASPEAEAAASAIYNSADACLTTVRAHGTKYDETAACSALGELSLAYFQATSGGKGSTATELRFTHAERMAWTARAMSDSCSKTAPRVW